MAARCCPQLLARPILALAPTSDPQDAAKQNAAGNPLALPLAGSVTNKVVGASRGPVTVQSLQYGKQAATQQQQQQQTQQPAKSSSINAAGIDTELFPWADPAGVPKISIVPSFLRGVPVPPVPEWTPERVQESCVTRAIMSTVLGGALGAVFGIAIGSFGAIAPPQALPGMPEPPALPIRQAVKQAFLATGQQAKSSAKNFAMIGGVFSAVECVLEKYRGKHDIKNPVLAGCITGAAFGARAGPLAACGGCLGFAAFSGFIETIGM